MHILGECSCQLHQKTSDLLSVFNNYWYCYTIKNLHKWFCTSTWKIIFLRNLILIKRLTNMNFIPFLVIFMCLYILIIKKISIVLTTWWYHHKGQNNVIKTVVVCQKESFVSSYWALLKVLIRQKTNGSYLF